MRLEFLPDGSDDCPLVRLFAFTPAEVAGLHAAVTALAAGEQSRVEVHHLPGVEGVTGCRLTLHAGGRDRGLVPLPVSAAFDCILTRDGWDTVAHRIEPFLSECDGYQWLDDTGDTDWLLSWDGQW